MLLFANNCVFPLALLIRLLQTKHLLCCFCHPSLQSIIMRVTRLQLQLQEPLLPTGIFFIGWLRGSSVILDKEALCRMVDLVFRISKKFFLKLWFAHWDDELYDHWSKTNILLVHQHMPHFMPDTITSSLFPWPFIWCILEHQVSEEAMNLIFVTKPWGWWSHDICDA